jgi:hypothetical protein
MCPMEKQVRLRIGSKFPKLLPRLGLSAREWAARQVYAKRSPAEREAMAERGKTALGRLKSDSNDKTT